MSVAEFREIVRRSNTVSQEKRYNLVESEIADIDMQIAALNAQRDQLRGRIDQRLLEVLQKAHSFMLGLPFDIFEQANPSLKGEGYNISVPEDLSAWGYIPDAYKLVVLPREFDPNHSQTGMNVYTSSWVYGFNEHLKPQATLELRFVPDGFYDYADHSSGAPGRWHQVLYLGEGLSSIEAMKKVERSTVGISAANGGSWTRPFESSRSRKYGYINYGPGHDANEFHHVTQLPDGGGWLHPIEQASFFLDHMALCIKLDGRRHKPTVEQLSQPMPV